MKRNSKIVLPALLAMGSIAQAQTSSLYMDKSALHPEPPPRTGPNEEPERLSNEIARVSLAAVRPPDPHKFAVHDLITIVINESTASDSKANFNTTKDSKYDGDATEFPNLNLIDLLNGQLKAGSTTANPPQVAVHMKKDFTGDGEAQRSDTFTDRLTAQVIDVKPNGTLVLEARKYTKTDEETLEMVLTGTCRKEDVTTDNTLLSSQIFDLHLTKNHKGQLKSGTDKGWISKIMDGLFGF